MNQSENLARLLNQFNKEYAFLYDNRDNVAGFSEAVTAFNNMTTEEKAVCNMFCKYRGDLITSDREAAAFIFALDAV